MWRPRIKFEYRPVRYSDGTVRIGGGVPGLTAGVRDPDGSVWALLGLLDGSRTVDQVVADLIHQFSARSEVEVRAAIRTLDDAGYLEDASEQTLTDAERERYSRSHAWWRWVDRTPQRQSWEAQLQLRQARVVVIGVGGAGGTAALALTASGVGQLHCVDPDTVELSNLNRQVLFTEHDLGRLKVDAALDRLRVLNSNVHLTAATQHIDGPAAVRALAIGCDVLLLAADQPAREIRSWTNQACHATGTAWVHTGYNGPQVNVGVYRPGTGPCSDCAHAAEQHRRANLAPRTVWAPGIYGAQTHAANAVSAGMAGYLAAHVVMSLITGAPALRLNCEFGLNLVTLQYSDVAGLTSPWPDCPTCGPAG